MDLILWRHADAIPGSETLPDMDRPLSPKGHKQAKRMGEWLNRVLPENARVLSSPAVRAIETVEALERRYKKVASLAPDATVDQLLAEVRHKVAVIIPPEFNRFQHAFSHIFAGGYAAGYYSYKWAEVLSADAYSAFEEAAKLTGSVLDPITGARYREEILEVGGSRPAAESFKAFRGREPSIDALLRHGGLA